jgi:hypothetical protein
MYISFQKNTGSFVDNLISYFTKSEIIHCELVTTKSTKDNAFYGYSSYPGEGVRCGWIGIDDNWIILPLNKTKFKDLKAQDVKDFYEKTKGRKYDWLGCLGFVFGNHDNPKRYFCSEWCATVMGIENPSKISPAKLYEIVKNSEGTKDAKDAKDTEC